MIDRVEKSTNRPTKNVYVHINTSKIKTIQWSIDCITLCLGHELCQIKFIFINIIIIIYLFTFFMCLREFLKEKLICTILLFFSCMTFHLFSCQAWQSLCEVEKHAYWWLFSLSLSLSFFTMPGMNIPCETQISLSFRKWGVWYDGETKLMSMKQFFHVSLAFIAIDELVRYVFISMQYQKLHNHKLKQLYSR